MSNWRTLFRMEPTEHGSADHVNYIEWAAYEERGREIASLRQALHAIAGRPEDAGYNLSAFAKSVLERSSKLESGEK